MATLTSLPCEVVANILRNLDNIQSLVPCLLSCRHIYTSFRESPGIAVGIIQQQVGQPLLPYVVAAVESSHIQIREATTDSVRGLLDIIHAKPTELTGLVRSFSLPRLQQMGYTHNLITRFANDFAADAWSLFCQQASYSSSDVSLSAAELFRFCRALYRVDIFLALSRTDNPGAFAECQYECFFSQLPPWEIEQLGCVYDFLERSFSSAVFEVLAHDIDFGEFSVDYLTLGEDNYRKQRWLSQGLSFIGQLVYQDSYDKKNDNLQSKNASNLVIFHETLRESLNAAELDQRLLKDYSNDELEKLLPPLDISDMDNGPRVVWCAIHADDPFDLIMMDNDAGLRERAYVLWDLDRVQRYGLIRVFENTPNEPSHMYSLDDKAYIEMQDSFHERSKLWRTGRSGYWSKDDA
ncbi:hypothetical protein BX600DRAFT_475279 [Xylariales sp. PMI_506]|nr:hypothetical protein BX600DRAFT_475279 [Xylariales sp. PMI_506]